MIVSDFFQTDLYIESELDDSVELSNNINGLNLSYSNDWPDAYWYGWLRWETAPDAIKMCSVDFSGSDRDWTIAGDHHEPRNFNVGYMTTGFMPNSQPVDGQRPLYSILFYSENNGVYSDPINDVVPYSGSRFINKLDPRGVVPIHGGNVVSDYNSIQLLVHLGRIVGNNHVYYNNSGFTNIRFNEEDGIFKFLNGDISANISYNSWGLFDDMQYNVGSVSFSYDLNINNADFGRDIPNVWSYYFSYGGYDYVLNVCIVGFGFPTGRDMISSTNVYSGWTMRIMPIIGQNAGGTNYVSVGTSGFSNYICYNATTNETIYESNFSGYSWCETVSEIDGFYMGGFNGEMSVNYDNLPCWAVHFDENCNFAVMAETQAYSHNLSRLRLFRIMSPEEIRHCATLNMRYVTNDDYTSGSYGFGSGCYYPHISPENEYLCEWLTGEFDEIEDELRPWQYGDISDNEYNPKDLPPYEPPIPPLPDDKFSGDEIIPTLNLAAGTASDFITIYALTKTQISHIGSTLWSHIFDPDFRQSIGTIWAEDFTLDPAHIVDYITSMRMFPFGAEQMGNDFYTDTGNNLLYIGRGVTGLQVEGAHTFVVNYYSKSIYGGTVTVPFPYRDFKAYEPYSEVILHVPFCGSCALTPSEVMGENLSLTYIIDFSTGDVTAYCMVMSNVWKIVAVLTGKMGCEIQYTGGNFMQGMSNGLNAVIQAASNVAETAAGAYVPAMSSNESGSNIIHNATAKTGREIGDIGDAGGSYVGILNSMLSSKTPPTRATSKGFASLGQLVPYVEVTTKRFVIPNNFGEVCGFACNFSAVLKTLESTTGNNFTMCRNVKVDELTCTADEQLRIKQLLESGIFI